MKLISCHDGKLHALDAGSARAGSAASTAGCKAFHTGLAALDALSPGGAFARGAVHELLTAPADGTPMFFAAMLARRAWAGTDDATRNTGAVVWSDPRQELYPPAVATVGIPLERLFLLHPKDAADHVWAVAECLRCRGVAAVVAALPERHRLSRVEARRLQLAAERGGGVGLLLRTDGKASDEHAAVTRWLIRPAKGERNVQRWRIQLLFGHGGRVGQSIILEHHRDPQQQQQSLPPRIEAHPVRPAAELADRPLVPPAGRVTA
jgi:protein ImuA